MKAIRRFLSLAMVCLLLCGLLPGFALAEDTAETGKIVLGGDTAGQPGDTVKVEVKVEECPGIMGMKFSPLYDSAVLKLTNTEVSVGAPWDNTVVQETGVVLLDTGADAALSGVIATYTFQILETAAAGETQVNLEVSAGSGNGDADEQRVNFNVTAATITVAGSGPVASPSNIAGFSVNFKGKLEINIYLKLSDEIAADPEAYVITSFNGTDTKHTVAQLLTDTMGQYVVVRQRNIYAAMMRDELKMQIFNSAGEVQPLTLRETTDVTEGFTYTVLEYLKTCETSTSVKPAMKELARTALLYGIAAQVKFGYKTEQLTAEDIAMMEAEADAVTIPDTCDEIVTGSLPAGIPNRGKTVAFEADNTLRQIFQVSDADVGNYTFTVDGASVTPIRRAASQWYIEQANIGSGNLSKSYTFSVSDGTDSFSGESSVLSYCYYVQLKSADTEQIRLCKVIYLYSQAADVYFGN